MKRPPDFGRRAMNVGAGAILLSFVVPLLPGVLGVDPGPAGAAAVNALTAQLMIAGAYTLLVAPLVLFAVYTLHPWRPVLSAQAHAAGLTGAAVLALGGSLLFGEATALQKSLLVPLIALAVAVGVRCLKPHAEPPPRTGDPSVGRPVAVFLGAVFMVGGTATATMLEAPQAARRAGVEWTLRNLAGAQNRHARRTGGFATGVDSLRFERRDGVTVRMTAGAVAWSALGETEDPYTRCHALGRLPESDSASAAPRVTCHWRRDDGDPIGFLAVGFGVPLVLAIGSWSWATRQQATEQELG